MFSEIKSKVQSYANYLESLKAEAQKLRELLLQNKIKGLIEEQQLQTISSVSKGNVLGVDSGFFDSSLTGLDFCYIKCAGSYFEYDSKLAKYEKLTSSPEYFFTVSQNILQKEEIQKYTSINRLKKELKLLYSGIKKHNPEYALIDGNILPQAVDRPNNSSELYLEYEELLQDFIQLYDLAKSQNVNLLGCVEDSRANSFLKLATTNKELINQSDTLFLNYLLAKGECISFFPIFSVESNIIYNDLKQYGNFSFSSSYLKINDDYPLRIELLNNNYSGQKLKEIKGFIAYLSNYSRDYCFPSVLVDADKQAKLNPKEIETVKNLVDSYTLPLGIKSKRRERRI